MTVNVLDFIARAMEIYNESPGDEHGHCGNDGLCDCIGLVIGAIRRAGGQWHGMHGSNYAARNEMVSLEKIVHSGTLVPGEVVYKAKSPDDSGYDLPDRYKTGTDLRDYYHVGVVVSATPLRICHMTTPKPKIDTTIGKWAWHGRLKKSTTEGRRYQWERRRTIRPGSSAAVR